MMPTMAGRGVQGSAVAVCAPLRRARGRTVARIVVLGCAVAALSVVPAHAQILTQVGVTEPGAGASVASSRVVVDVIGLTQADGAQARIIAGGQTRTHDLSGPESITGGSRWVGTLDLGGLPNGPARVEGRALFSDSTSDWTGHEVRLDLPTPPISLTVAPAAGDAVALSWSAAAVPDVSGYQLERAPAGGGFAPLVTVGAGQLSHTDVGVPPGEHRYRVRAVRPGGDGGAKPGPWAEGVVLLAPPGAAGGDLASQGSGPTSGVAARPPTGGISARLRAGTEGIGAPDMDLPAPQVAPRDLGGPAAVADGQGAPSEEIALGDDQPLAITQEGPLVLGGDGPRLVALCLVALLAMRARRMTHPGSPSPMQVRLSPGPGPGGGGAWRGARDWSRGPRG